MEISECKLKDLQPSQLYISEKKLRAVEEWLDASDLSNFEPIPIKQLDNRPVITDGHTRAVAALRAGLDTVPLVWDEDELPLDMYRACVAACREQKIKSPEDLLPRIVSEDAYREKWYKWCEGMQAELTQNEIVIKPYTKQRIPDVLAFEQALRAEEDFWGWEINEAYIKRVTASFEDAGFSNSLSFLAYQNDHVIGRIDAALLPSHFDGSTKAYLDWICVLKSCRHKGAAQKLLSALRNALKERNVDTLIALTASNDEAQRFYKAVPDSEMRDIGIWIDIK